MEIENPWQPFLDRLDLAVDAEDPAHASGRDRRWGGIDIRLGLGPGGRVRMDVLLTGLPPFRATARALCPGRRGLLYTGDAALDASVAIVGGEEALVLLDEELRAELGALVRAGCSLGPEGFLVPAAVSAALSDTAGLNSGPQFAGPQFAGPDGAGQPDSDAALAGLLDRGRALLQALARRRRSEGLLIALSERRAAESDPAVRARLAQAIERAPASPAQRKALARSERPAEIAALRDALPAPPDWERWSRALDADLWSGAPGLRKQGIAALRALGASGHPPPAAWAHRIASRVHHEPDGVKLFEQVRGPLGEQLQLELLQSDASWCGAVLQRLEPGASELADHLWWRVLRLGHDAARLHERHRARPVRVLIRAARADHERAARLTVEGPDLMLLMSPPGDETLLEELQQDADGPGAAALLAVLTESQAGSFDDDQQAWLVGALAATGHPDAEKPLLACLARASSTELRVAAIEGLGRVGSAAAREALGEWDHGFFVAAAIKEAARRALQAIDRRSGQGRLSVAAGEGQLSLGQGEAGGLSIEE